jgi:hypothetical protein
MQLGRALHLQGGDNAYSKSMLPTVPRAPKLSVGRKK